MTHSYRLYGRPGTGSASVEAALALAGVAVELVDVDKADLGALDDLRQVNALAQVPVLVLPDGTIVTESTAILLHVADAFPRIGLAPEPGSAARATHDRWLMHLQTNIYEGELRKAYPARYTSDSACAAEVQEAASDHVKRHFVHFERAFAGTPGGTGRPFTVLDLYVWMLCNWMDRAWLAAHCPATLAISDAVAANATVAPVHARHF